MDSDEVVYIQLLFRKVNTSIITEFPEEEVKSSEHIDKSISKLDTYNIPISVKNSSLGINLNTYSKDGFIHRVDYNINGVTDNFIMGQHS